MALWGSANGRIGLTNQDTPFPVGVPADQPHYEAMPRPRRGPSPSICIDLTLDSSSSDDTSNDSDDGVVLNVVAGNPIGPEHVAILRTGAWLTDEIINSYLHTLSQHTQPRHVTALSSHLCTLVAREGAQSPSVHRWLRPLQPLGLCRLVLLPVNLGNAHWALLAYDVRARRLMYYDSMMHKRTAQNVLTRYQPVFQRLALDDGTENGEDGDSDDTGDQGEEEDDGLSSVSLSSSSSSDGLESVTAGLSGLGLGDPSPIELVIPGRQPRQLDGSSCGVFVCKWAQVLTDAYGRDPPGPVPAFTQSDVTRHRQHILDALLSHTY